MTRAAAGRWRRRAANARWKTSAFAARSQAATAARRLHQFQHHARDSIQRQRIIPLVYIPRSAGRRHSPLACYASKISPANDDVNDDNNNIPPIIIIIIIIISVITTTTTSIFTTNTHKKKSIITMGITSSDFPLPPTIITVLLFKVMTGGGALPILRPRAKIRPLSPTARRRVEEQDWPRW
ncbi:hypothetical protein E2C01_039015 [Portunus trituberculatus]|uniref:Uncharacterized protein n=1 Tax=Portunus trituberculatus TaxID=210409 RepID=A0A5B7FCH4_PORTR|nr:hypothetical protein [Portunus trituberculatus]